MSWYSRVAWSEGLFLRQHHLQQSDRFFAKLLDNRTRLASPYPWGFSNIKINGDLTQQAKVGLSQASGIFQDGTPFDMPGAAPLPTEIDVEPGSEGEFIWITMPASVVNVREFDMKDATSGSRYVKDMETIIDSSSSMHVEQSIEIAHPRVELEIRRNAKSGFNCLPIARILEVRDNTVVLDQTFAPPTIVIDAHPVVTGWLDRVIGWMDAKLQTLARYASDPSAGGGLQSFDYFMLQMLNREINVLRHYKNSHYTHPADLFVELLRLSGELATFSPDRLVPQYEHYDHDEPEKVFSPILSDIQRLLSLDIGRAIRLDLVERAANAYLAHVNDRSLFQTATFVIEVSANKPLTEIQRQFPSLCKVGPNTKMNEIVQTNLPGIELVHMPTPPRQIRTVSDHVYFFMDKKSELWPEFSSANSMGLHFAGEWPELVLDLWAIVEDKR